MTVASHVCPACGQSINEVDVTKLVDQKRWRAIRAVEADDSSIMLELPAQHARLLLMAMQARKGVDLGDKFDRYYVVEKTWCFLDRCFAWLIPSGPRLFELGVLPDVGSEGR